MARDREPVPLDRVREDRRRPVGRPRLGERLLHVDDVVAAEIPDEGADGAVVGLEHTGQRVAVSNRERTLERLDDLLVGRREQLLVLLVRHLVDPRSQKLTAGLRERGAQLAPVLQLDHAPARTVEAALERLGADHRHDAVERLAVEVDDPDRLLQPARRRVEDRLPDVALVELGVADQRDEAAAGPAELAVVVHVALHQRTEQRRGGAEPDRPGRVVDGDRILRPARVGLQAAEVAKRAQVRLVEPAQQVLEGVQHGRCVRLHADAVVALQLREPERRHDRDEARGRGLVPADLDRVERWPLAVRVVDHAHREPEDALLDAPERVLGERWRWGSPQDRGLVHGRDQSIARSSRARRGRSSQASTVTSVPIGVSGQICFAVSSWSSTQPRLWGVP